MAPALCLMASAGLGLSVDEVIAKNAAAHGGEERWSAVKSLKITGQYESFSVLAPFVIWRKRPDLYRFDHHLNQKPVTVAFDGERAWWKNGLISPNHQPSPIPAPQSKVALREKMFEPLFVRFGEKGVKARLAGKQDLDGEPHYEIETTWADGAVERWFIHARTFLASKVRAHTYDFGRKVIFEAFFSDYREVNGVMLPFLVEEEFHTRYRVMAVERAEVNGAIDDALFAMPSQ